MTADRDHPRTQTRAGRDDRLASALRANLQRRKAQARGRSNTRPAGGEGSDQPAGSHDSAGIVDDKPAR
jgi:hypothetical protein